MRFLIALSLLISCSVGFSKLVEVTLKVEKVGEVIHWAPDTIEVSPDDKLIIHAEHNLTKEEGAADFHGLFIPQLKISEKVERNKPVTVTRSIPKSLKVGEYNVGCQFHPKHAPAKLIVRTASH